MVNEKNHNFVKFQLFQLDDYDGELLVGEDNKLKCVC